MEKIRIGDAVRAMRAELIKGKQDDIIEGVCHDSRECSAGDMFVAIKGENHDGHDYIPQVIGNGCRCVLISDETYAKDIGEDVNVILADDTVRAMGDLAAYYLDLIDPVKIAVTGSVGKTSVRDMIYYVLSERYRCVRNMKNFNNLIGLPLSVFKADSSTEVVVLEMGMSEFGEIDRLAGIVRPNIGVITNIGISHIESLGSREGIFRAKMEMAPHITGRDGTQGVLVFARDDTFLTKERTEGDYRQIAVGRDGRSDYIISDVDDFGLDGIKFTLEHFEKSRRMYVPVAGEHNAVNGALAAAVGDVMGLDAEETAKGLEKTELTGSRLKKRENGILRIIDDTYNASPDSVRSALKVLECSRCEGRRTAILGDMYELGDESEKAHLGVGMFAGGLDIDIIAAVGTAAEKIYEGAKGGKAQALYYRDREELYRHIDDIAGKGDLILVKGSRGMHMEEVVEKILDH